MKPSIPSDSAVEPIAQDRRPMSSHPAIETKSNALEEGQRPMRIVQNSARVGLKIFVPIAMLASLTLPDALGAGGGNPSVQCVGPYQIDVCDCVDTAFYQAPYVPPLGIPCVCGTTTCLPRWTTQRCNIAMCANVGYSSMTIYGVRTCRMFLPIFCDGNVCIYDTTPTVTLSLYSYFVGPQSNPCRCECSISDTPPCPTPF